MRISRLTTRRLLTKRLLWLEFKGKSVSKPIPSLCRTEERDKNEITSPLETLWKSWNSVVTKTRPLKRCRTNKLKSPFKIIQHWRVHSVINKFCLYKKLFLVLWREPQPFVFFLVFKELDVSVGLIVGRIQHVTGWGLSQSTFLTFLPRGLHT